MIKHCNPLLQLSTVMNSIDEKKYILYYNLMLCTLCITGDPEHNAAACGGACVLRKSCQRQAAEGPLHSQRGPPRPPRGPGSSLVQQERAATAGAVRRAGRASGAVLGHRPAL